MKYKYILQQGRDCDVNPDPKDEKKVSKMVDI